MHASKLPTEAVQMALTRKRHLGFVLVFIIEDPAYGTFDVAMSPRGEAQGL